MGDEFKLGEYTFRKASLQFFSHDITSVFAQKNNKTLLQTITHKRYLKLSDDIKNYYPEYLNWPLGNFLYELKIKNNLFYLNFINKYGDRSFCEFTLQDEENLHKSGLYLFCVDANLKYIGRCKDSFKKRINSGYGKINPKNCYLDGQSTNCRINSLIAKHQEDISLWLLPMPDNKTIEQLERELINQYAPEWNLTLI